MKRLINGLLAMVGLVTVRRYHALMQQLEQVKAGSLEWKAKARESTARATALETEVKQHARHAQKSELYLAKMRARREEMNNLRARLAAAERELVVAREHLMAIEVKLDILEGAANVLDARTRGAIVKEPSRTSAPV